MLCHIAVHSAKIIDNNSWMNKIFWCKNCLNMSTRPRIEFDDRGWCNACQWMEEKKTFDWASRQQELVSLLDEHRSKDGHFDVIVPVSGGKDGSYVAYNLKHKYGMRPLTVTVRPSLELSVGKDNLHNFINSGYEHIHVTPNPDTMQKLNKFGLVEKGSPYFGWLMSIFTTVIRTANNFNCGLIVYGEDGEIEYGGSTKHKHVACFDKDYITKNYYEGDFERLKEVCSEEELYFWKFPTEEEWRGRNLSLTHFSYFEAWDSYRNYLVAKEHCGLQENQESNTGTFTNFAQNDQAIFALHCYLMYLKFGFGRATQDAGIEIRRGAMTRKQALNLVKVYDNQYPEEFIETYLDYYKMERDEFDAVIDKFANKELFKKVNDRWQPIFEVGQEFVCA